ncbi:hypothetical protein JW865_05035, partial [Candidatus Bathyarchaeota archaeon]|nr:hypothetical protein [Candidatus Bathyarchaeota archaeon]
MLHNLDDFDYIKQLDSKNMLDAVHRFPENCIDAINTAEKNNLNHINSKDFKSILIVGMGGSAVGGLLIRDWLKFSCKLPIYVVR